VALRNPGVSQRAGGKGLVGRWMSRDKRKQEIRLKIGKMERNK